MAARSNSAYFKEEKSGKKIRVYFKPGTNTPIKTQSYEGRLMQAMRKKFKKK